MSQDWTTFFTTLAQVAATAFSLMFVSMQVRSKEWRQSRLRIIAALSALVELFIPVGISLVAVMGAHPWRIAAGVGALGGLGMVAAHRYVYASDRSLNNTDRFDRKQASGAWFSLFVYSSILIAAVVPTSTGLYMLASMCVWLLISGSFEAWWLLEPTGFNRESSAYTSDALAGTTQATACLIDEPRPSEPPYALKNENGGSVQSTDEVGDEGPR